MVADISKSSVVPVLILIPAVGRCYRGRPGLSRCRAMLFQYSILLGQDKMLLFQDRTVQVRDGFTV